MVASSKFKSHAESVPELAEIIEHFLNGRYDEFDRCLQSIHAHLRFDTVLGTKLEKTLQQIKRKAIIQYVAPYKVVDLKQVGQAFHMNDADIEEEIAALILSKQIKGKIDSHQKLLYSFKEDQQVLTYRKALESGNRFMQDSKQMVLRSNQLAFAKVLESNEQP